MSKRTPAAPRADRLPGVTCEISETVLAKWNPGLRAAAADEPGTISIFDPVGYDTWSDTGVTANRIAGALRAIGKDKPVDVLINSPGGDVFEGLAIYNLLREHKGEVRVKVIGVAASIASVIAMAGDRVEIARSAFFMIHNSWVVAGGNRHQLREIADTLEPFDRAMADTYAARTGLTDKSVGKLMDAETWINGEDAVADGFADALLDADQVIADDKAKAGFVAVRETERRLRASGLSRAEAKRLVAEIRTPEREAGNPGERDAADKHSPEVLAAFAELRATARNILNS
jgi:ATP-dependent Clp protease protease subunit